MNRRDTILVAVLVNVGLLIVLFASALKSTTATENFAATMSPPKLPEAPSVKDEVDLVLNQYATTHPVVAPPSQNLPVVQLSEIPSTPVISQSFVEELKVAAEPQPLFSPEKIAEPAAIVSFTEYKVKKGDVLEKIARHHHCSVADLKKNNQLVSNHLKIGQILKIPSVSKIKPAPSPTKAVEDASFKYYTIKAGDNPWTIAMKHHMKVEELLKLNNLDEAKARRLKAGDQIRIE